MLFVLTIAVLGLFNFFAYRWGWLIIVAFVSFFAFGQFVFPLLTQRKIRGYENKLAAQQKVEASASLTMLIGGIGARIGDKVFFFLFASWILVNFAHSLGYVTAKNQQDYFVLTDTPDHVVAAMDDELIILVAYDAGTMTLKRAYTVRRLASERFWPLEKKHIGKLLQPEPLKASSPSLITPTPSR